MTKRRPHWDDDLLAAVLRYLHDPAPLTDDDRAWSIVEAVEGWQEREKTRCKSDRAYHCTTHDTQWLDDESDRCEYKRMIDAEAAIARVRDVCDRIWDDARYAHKYGFLEVVREVRYALDGPQ